MRRLTKKEEWFQSKNGDYLFSIEEALHRFLIDSFRKEKQIEFSIYFDENSFIYSSNDLLKNVDVVVSGFLKKNIDIKHQQKIKVFLENQLCKNCLNLRGGNYYLSIIQLRVINESHFNIIKRVLDNIQIYVENQFEKDPKQYITKMIDQKNGIDLYLSTKELMNHIISFLRKDYHFQLKRSKKLVGRDVQKGKNIFRLKSLIKFLPINKNDIVLVENHRYKVDSITKNKIAMKGGREMSKSIKPSK